MAYGYDPLLGFQAKPYLEILDDMKASIRADVAPDLVLDAEDPVGQIVMTTANAIAEVWEVAQDGSDALDPDNAEGATLTGVAALTGTTRLPATRSTVTVNCTLTAGTTLVAGAARVHPPGKPSVLFALIEDYTALANGIYPLEFRALNYGPVEAFAGTLTIIAPAVSGWSAATNPMDADKGRLEESDSDLRIRRREDLATVGSAYADAVREDMDELVQSIYPSGGTFVLENTSALVVDGMAPHSIELIVWDGPSPTVSNQVIAETLYRTKAMGIGTNGNIAMTVLDGRLVPHEVRFRRATQLQIHFAITATYDPNIVITPAQVTATALAVKTAIVNMGLERRVVGLDIIRPPFFRAISSVPGIVDVTRYSVAAGAPPGPSETVSPVVVPRRQIAIIDSANVAVTLVRATEL